MDLWTLWKKIEDEHPLVHCITNVVTVNDCANILLAAGASPTMAHHPLEAAEVTEGCRSLVCNCGATESLDACFAAGKRAHELHHPIVLDPVGAAGAAFRRNSCLELMDAIHPDCIRGNYSEIRALALRAATGAGVDVQESDAVGISSGRAFSDFADLVKQLARQQKCFVIASGAADLVTDGERLITVTRGSRLMTKVTGTGCMSSALLGAFLAVENSLESAAALCHIMGICGELAEQRTLAVHGGTGTFRVLLTDAVSTLQKEDLLSR